jgi:hypothetical protein
MAKTPFEARRPSEYSVPLRLRPLRGRRNGHFGALPAPTALAFPAAPPPAAREHRRPQRARWRKDRRSRASFRPETTSSGRSGPGPAPSAPIASPPPAAATHTPQMFQLLPLTAFRPDTRMQREPGTRRHVRARSFPRRRHGLQHEDLLPFPRSRRDAIRNRVTEQAVDRRLLCGIEGEIRVLDIPEAAYESECSDSAPSQNA